MNKNNLNTGRRAKALTKPGIAIATSRLLLFLALVITAYFTTTESSYPVAQDINDKLGHILSFFVLALLADLSFPRKSFSWKIWLPLILYGLIIEIIQYHLPYRTFSLLDWAADAAGIFLYALAIHNLLNRKPDHK